MDDVKTAGSETRLSLCPFRSFRGITVDLFSNDPFRSFVQVFIERVLDLQKFRPESVVDERSWSPHDDRRVALATVAIGFKTVAATQCGEQAPAPLIGERELRFYRLFSLRRDSKSFSHPIDRSRRCVRSPMVVAPSNSAEILRNFSRSSCSVVIEIVNASKREPRSACFGTREFYCSASLRASESHAIDSIHLGSAESGRSAEEYRPNLKVFDPRPI